MAKTNAIRLLAQAGIPCREAFYPFDERDVTGLRAAQAIGLPPAQVFKTLVARGTRGNVAVFCIPVCHELDMRKAAAALVDKKVELVSVNELRGLTGYVRGGCSPVGMKKQYPTFLDQTAGQYKEIAVSAGARGHQMLVPPLQLASLVQAEFRELIKTDGKGDNRMQYTYQTKGTCSQEIQFEIEDNKLKHVVFHGGCNGNLKGISTLVEGMDVDEVIAKIDGIRCGAKATSCPDQLAQALKAAKGQD